MKKIFFVGIGAALVFASMAWALVSSYGQITGSATVNQSISWDILESYSDVSTAPTNDTYYELETTYQGETKWVKLKIIDKADVAIPVNLNISSSTADVNITMWDENQTTTLTNPVSVPPADLYLWLKHEFSAAADLGNYSFTIDIAPA